MRARRLSGLLRFVGFLRCADLRKIGHRQLNGRYARAWHKWKATIRTRRRNGELEFYDVALIQQIPVTVF